MHSQFSTINGGTVYYAQAPVTDTLIPGLRVVYGDTAQFNNYLPGQEKPKGFFSRLKDAVIDIVTEETSDERPIGISQLTRKTFTASEAVTRTTIVRPSAHTQRALQDYRFTQLTR